MDALRYDLYSGHTAPARKNYVLADGRVLQLGADAEHPIDGYVTTDPFEQAVLGRSTIHRKGVPVDAPREETPPQTTEESSEQSAPHETTHNDEQPEEAK